MVVAVETPTYASLERLLGLYETQPGEARLARLAEALRTATDELVEELSGRDYFRHPAAAADDPETWSPAPVEIDGVLLHCHDGIVSLEDLTLNDEAVTDYVLQGTGPYDRIGYGEPAFHVRLTSGRFRRTDTIELTGIRGWPAVPEALAEACAARARQIAYGDGSYSGSVAGPDEMAMSGPFGSERWPQVFYRFLRRERDRFAACLFAND